MVLNVDPAVVTALHTAPACVVRRASESVPFTENAQLNAVTPSCVVFMQPLPRPMASDRAAPSAGARALLCRTVGVAAGASIGPFNTCCVSADGTPQHTRTQTALAAAGSTGYDAVLMSETLYDPAHYPALARLLVQLLQPAGSFAYVCGTPIA